MAEEKPRAPRARKATVSENEKSGETTSAKRLSRTKAAASSKPAVKKKATAARKAKEPAAVAVLPGDVATLAYLLWERGEPGDAAEHWLRAERELTAA